MEESYVHKQGNHVSDVPSVCVQQLDSSLLTSQYVVTIAVTCISSICCTRFYKFPLKDKEDSRKCLLRDGMTENLNGWGHCLGC